MNRVLLSGIAALLVVLAVAASTAYFLVPFSPKVTFMQPELAFSSDSRGTQYPEVSVMIRNDGAETIWYRGNPGVISEFSIKGDLEDKERYEQKANKVNSTWVELPPQSSAVVPIPVYMLQDVAKLEIEFRDWRRQAAKCVSEKLDFSSVPINGVAGTGTRPPQPIPQFDEAEGETIRSSSDR